MSLDKKVLTYNSLILVCCKIIIGISLKLSGIIAYLLQILLKDYSHPIIELFCVGLIIIIIGFAAKGIIDSILNEIYSTDKPVPIFKEVKNLSSWFKELKNSIHQADINVNQLFDKDLPGSITDKIDAYKEQTIILNHNTKSFVNYTENKMSNTHEIIELILILDEQSKKLAYLYKYIFFKL